MSTIIKRGFSERTERRSDTEKRELEELNLFGIGQRISFTRGKARFTGDYLISPLLFW